jgi:hypothetical protein
MFFPDLVDLVCPGEKKNGKRNLMNICLVLDYVETDLDSMLKC